MARETKSRGSLYFMPGAMNVSPGTAAPLGRVMLLMMLPMNPNGPIPAATSTDRERDDRDQEHESLDELTQVALTIPAVATMKTTRRADDHHLIS